MSFSNSSRDDPLLLLTFAALLTECAKWNVVTTNKDRDQLMRELTVASGMNYRINGSAPVSRSATKYVQNSNE